MNGTTDFEEPILSAAEPHPVRVRNPRGRSKYLLLGDHAGNRIPRTLGTLGLSVPERRRHIAWDIGIAGLGRRLSGSLDATFISQRYSRLVVDCNRNPETPAAMPEVSDFTAIPGNAGLTPLARAARIAAMHEPYHAAIAAELDRRADRREGTIIVALHSFTPSMAGVARPWQVGVLHGAGNTGPAHRLLDMLRADAALTVGDNEPYRMDDTDYTVPRHAFPRGLAYLELEIRQDLIATAEGEAEWAMRLADLLPQT